MLSVAYTRLDERTGQLSMKGRLRQGQYEVKVKVYDVVWKHEVVSTVTVVVKEVDDVAIANAASLRIQGNIVSKVTSFFSFLHTYIHKTLLKWWQTAPQLQYNTY